MAIIANDLDEKKAVSQVKESLADKITEQKGSVTFEDFWGAKGFAYKIHGQKWGYYVVLQFELDPENLSELEREWNIDPKVVRFLVSKVDPRAGDPVTQAERVKEMEAQKKEDEIAEMEAETKKAASVKKAKSEDAASKTEEKDSEGKKDAVDKKLDQILDDASLDL